MKDSNIFLSFSERDINLLFRDTFGSYKCVVEMMWVCGVVNKDVTQQQFAAESFGTVHWVGNLRTRRVHNNKEEKFEV